MRGLMIEEYHRRGLAVCVDWSCKSCVDDSIGILLDSVPSSRFLPVPISLSININKTRSPLQPSRHSQSTILNMSSLLIRKPLFALLAGTTAFSFRHDRKALALNGPSHSPFNSNKPLPPDVGINRRNRQTTTTTTKSLPRLNPAAIRQFTSGSILGTLTT